MAPKFPQMTADIEDAAVCLGVGRGTAAVYHLMCVMELGIHVVAKRLKLKKGQIDRKDWGRIFSQLNAAVQNLAYATSKHKKRRDLYAEILIHLNNVKDSWRNPTMHSRRRYTQ